MYEQTLFTLGTLPGQNVILEVVDVQVAFHDFFCETSLTQVYQNPWNEPIETVYTFPLSTDAVLLELEVDIWGRSLKGVVLEKTRAAEEYEQALEEGDSAILPEQPEPGMYTLNIGNVRPGEQVRIALKYAELFAWKGEALRFRLPLTIAPRYGDPVSAGLYPHQLLETGLTAENRFRIELRIAGLLADAELSSPSHPIEIRKEEGLTQVRLASTDAFMDRDFILVFRTCLAGKEAVLLDHDGEGGCIALASFAPRIPLEQDLAPRCLSIVVDCSGSMNGSSIALARQVVNQILGQLRPDDFFTIVAFGNSPVPFFEGQVQADREHILRARRRLRSLEANLGGTEMLHALRTVIQLPGPDIPKDILLITDGQVWEAKAICNLIKQSGQRVFSLGVGLAPSASFLQHLARLSGGAYESVSSDKDSLGETIALHFQRIVPSPVDYIRVRWPTQPEQDLSPQTGPVFNGDTLHVAARFRDRPTGQVKLYLFVTDGRVLTQTVELPQEFDCCPAKTWPGPLARMVIHQALQHETSSQALTWALNYQLLSQYTSCFVLAKRPEAQKMRDLPRLVKVPQMPAAGWMGLGRTSRKDDEVEIPCYIRRDPEEHITRLFQRKSSEQTITPGGFIQKLNQLHSNWFRFEPQLSTYDDLRDCGLPEMVVETIQDLADQAEPDASQAMVVLAFLLALVQSPLGRDLSRHARYVITLAGKSQQANHDLLQLMLETFARIRTEDWGIAWKTLVAHSVQE